MDDWLIGTAEAGLAADAADGLAAAGDVTLGEVEAALAADATTALEV